MNNAEQYYNRHSREYAEKWKTMKDTFTPSYYFRQYIMQAVLAAACLEKTDKVVEIGCGTGLVLREALKIVRPVFGTDISPEMLERVRDSVLSEKKIIIVNDFIAAGAHPETDVFLMVNNLLELNLPKNYFDKIISVEVLRYVENLDAALTNVARAMKSRSLFVFTITNFWSASFFPLKYSLRKIFGFLKPEKELLQYFTTKSTLFRKLKKTGFSVEKIERIGFLSVNPLTKKLIKNETMARVISRLDRVLSHIPLINAFFDTLLVTAKKQ